MKRGIGRPKIKRMIRFSPEIAYFKPAGIPLRELEEETLTLDEVEALRLSDFEGLFQEEASNQMGVSRITYLNILNSAHQKIAKALIFGKAINMKGGEVIMPNLDTTGPTGNGPMAGRGAGRGQAGGNNAPGRGLGGSNDCICPSCGEKTPHTRGVPCSQVKCPKCGTPMRGVFCR